MRDLSKREIVFVATAEVFYQVGRGCKMKTTDAVVPAYADSDIEQYCLWVFYKELVSMYCTVSLGGRLRPGPIRVD